MERLSWNNGHTARVVQAVQRLNANDQSEVNFGQLDDHVLQKMNQSTIVAVWKKITIAATLALGSPSFVGTSQQSLRSTLR